MSLLILMATCGYAQEKVSAMELTLAEKKPRAVQFELSRANQTCAGVLDCNEDFHLTKGSQTDPCLWDKLACHMESFSRGNDFGQAWLVGGAKLRAEVGPLTFSVGRHKDNIVLTRAPFIEGSRQIGLHTQLSFGVLQNQKGLVGSQNIWYVVIRLTQWG